MCDLSWPVVLPGACSSHHGTLAKSQGCGVAATVNAVLTARALALTPHLTPLSAPPSRRRRLNANCMGTPALPTMPESLEQQGAQQQGRGTSMRDQPPAGTVPAHAQQPQAVGVPSGNSSVSGVRGQAQQHQQQRLTHHPASLQSQRHARRGLSMLLFGPTMQLSMTACGAPLRALLSLACKLHGSAGNSAVGDAFTALAMGRAVWLGDTSNASHKQRPTDVRLAAVPRRYQEAIVQFYSHVRTALRNQFGWRAVLLDAGTPLPLPRSDAGTTSNRFAALDSSPCGDEVAVVQAELRTEGPASLTGCVVKRRFHGKPWFGVATFMPEEEQPFVFRVRYTDGDSDTMRTCDVRRCAVSSWADVPHPLHTQLRALGARMHALLAPQQPQPAASQRSPPQLQPAVEAPAPQQAMLAAPAAAARPPAQQTQRAEARRRRRHAAGRSRSAAQRFCAGGLRVGTLNVCGLTATKASDIAGVLGKLHMDILAVGVWASMWLRPCCHWSHL